MPDRARFRQIPEIPEADKVTPGGSSSAQGHSHTTDQRSSRFWQLTTALLCVAVAGLGWLSWTNSQRLTAQEEYVAEAREYRDKQAVELSRRIDIEANERICGVLDRLPAGALWDPLREQYGCGPGISPELFDPGQVAALLGSYGLASFTPTPEQFYELLPQI